MTARTVYTVLLVIGLVWAYVLGGVMAYRLLLFLLCWPALSLLYLLLCRKKLNVHQHVDPMRPDKGVPCTYSVTLQNRARLLYLPHVYVRIREFDGYQNTPAEGVTALQPRGHTDLRIRMKFQYRGVYHVGVDTLRLTDPFGLFVCRPVPPQRLSVTVYPRLLTLPSCRLPHSSLSERHRKDQGLWEDRSEIRDLRGYQRGDALSRIHWKLSARKRQYITKLYEQEEGAEHLFLLDTCPPAADKRAALEASDRMIEGLLALMGHTLDEGTPVRLAYNGPDGPRQLNFKTARDVLARMEHFAVLSFDAHDPPETLLYTHSGFAGFSALTLVTARLSEETLGALSEVHSAQSPVSQVVVLPRTSNPREPSALSGELSDRVYTLVIAPDEDLVESLSCEEPFFEKAGGN